MDLISDILFKAFAYIVAISILVAVHEFGHFWVARRLGIKVLRFSIGFGRVIWSRHGKDGTEYALSAIPLGGYVRMLDERMLGEQDSLPVSEKDRAFSFNRAPVWKRIAVMFAGPGFNFLFAIVAYWVLFMAGVPGLTPVIGEVKPNSLASSAGLHSEDKILRVGDRDVTTREGAMVAILSEVVGDGVVELRVADKNGAERDASLIATGRSRQLTEPNALAEGLGFDFWRPAASTVAGSVVTGAAAEKAGIQVGDKIVRFGDVPVSDADTLTRLIRERPGKDVSLVVERTGQNVELQATIGEALEGDLKVGKLGIGFSASWPAEMQILQREGPIAAMSSAMVETWDKTRFTGEIIWRLLTGKVSLKSISGPIGIANAAGTVVKYGFAAALTFLAIISISIGVLNLLPVPILDGGQIVYQLAELLKGAPVSERAQVLGQQVGLVLLVMLMLLAVFNDLAPNFG
jgi:regulator of sigma E protease